MKKICPVSGELRDWTDLGYGLFICPCCGAEWQNGKTAHPSIKPPPKPAHQKRQPRPRGYGRPGPKPKVDGATAAWVSQRLLNGERMPKIAAELGVTYHTLWRSVVQAGGKGLKRWLKNR